MRLPRIAFTAVLLAGALAMADGARPPLGPAEASEIRGVIEGQLKAFAAGDGVLAFSYASPSIRTQFGNAGNFMTMVRREYPMLIGPSETLFAPPRVVDDGVIQSVHLRDHDGHAWRARYHVLRQADASWRVNGCVVDEDRDDTST